MMPISIINQYWPSLLIFFTALLTGLMVYFQATAQDIQKNRKYLLATALIAFLASVGSGIGSFVSSYKNDKQLQQVQESVEATKTLSELNKQLSIGIDSLQKINIEIAEKTKILAQNTDSITKEAKGLSQRNVQLTETLKPIVYRVDSLTKDISFWTDKIHNEQTGGKSLPIIYGVLETHNWLCNTYETSDFHKSYYNKRIIKLNVENTGLYPLRNINFMMRYWLKDKIWIRSDYKPLTGITELSAKKTKSINEAIVIGSHDIKFELDSSVVPSWEINVKWKLNYTYKMMLRIDSLTGEQTLLHSYLYKNQEYGPIEFIKTLMVDLKLQIDF